MHYLRCRAASPSGQTAPPIEQRQADLAEAAQLARQQSATSSNCARHGLFESFGESWRDALADAIGRFPDAAGWPELDARRHCSGETVRPGRVAILGGGMAGLSAAWRLSEPGWRDRFESITVYQRGWRLGRQGRLQPRGRTAGSKNMACTSGSVPTRTRSRCCGSATPNSTGRTTDPRSRSARGTRR